MIDCMGEILSKTNGISCALYKRTYLCDKKMSLKVDFKAGKGLGWENRRSSLELGKWGER